MAWVWFPEVTQYVGWVCCWFSFLLRGLLLRAVLRFFFLRKKTTFLNSNSIRISKNHLVDSTEILIYLFVYFITFRLVPITTHSAHDIELCSSRVDQVSFVCADSSFINISLNEPKGNSAFRVGEHLGFNTSLSPVFTTYISINIAAFPRSKC